LAVRIVTLADLGRFPAVRFRQTLAVCWLTGSEKSTAHSGPSFYAEDEARAEVRNPQLSWMTHKQAFSAASAPTRTGHLFKCWFSARDGPITDNPFSHPQ
jgi:hypothetical protein